MATLVGNDGKITFVSGGSAKEVLGLRNFSIEITSDTIEKTVMTDNTRQYLKGLSSWSGSADVYVDTANLTGGATVISELIATSGAVGGAPAELVAYLDSVTSPSGKKFTGNVIITGFTINSSMDGMIEGSVSFQGSGPVTYTA